LMVPNCLVQPQHDEQTVVSTANNLASTTKFLEELDATDWLVQVQGEGIEEALCAAAEKSKKLLKEGVGLDVERDDELVFATESEYLHFVEEQTKLTDSV